jgi:putative oxidoreductase
MALKNLAIAGGFLCLFAHRQVVWSYDALRLRRRADLATHDAELRAARAEAREAALAKAAAAGTATGATPLVDSDGDGIADSLSYRRRRWWSF